MTVTTGARTQTWAGQTVSDAAVMTPVAWWDATQASTACILLPAASPTSWLRPPTSGVRLWRDVV